MTPRTAAFLVALAAPIVAFGGGWTGGPEWLTSEVAWAMPLPNPSMTETQMRQVFDPPPRAAWCGPNGIERTPTDDECLDYDDDLTAWLMDVKDTNDPLSVATIPDPPTYCGGC